MIKPAHAGSLISSSFLFLPDIGLVDENLEESLRTMNTDNAFSPCKLILRRMHVVLSHLHFIKRQWLCKENPISCLENVLGKS